MWPLRSGLDGGGHARLEEHALRGGDAGAELDLVAELLEDHLEARRAR